MRKNTALITYADKQHADVALSYAGLVKREKGFKIDLYLQGELLNQRNIWMAKHRIYVGFIPKDLSESDFRETFAQYGSITEAYIHREVKHFSRLNDESVSHFYGFVNFEDPKIVSMLVELKFVPIRTSSGNHLQFPNFRLLNAIEPLS